MGALRLSPRAKGVTKRWKVQSCILALCYKVKTKVFVTYDFFLDYAASEEAHKLGCNGFNLDNNIMVVGGQLRKYHRTAGQEKRRASYPALRYTLGMGMVVRGVLTIVCSVCPKSRQEHSIVGKLRLATQAHCISDSQLNPPSW